MQTPVESSRSLHKRECECERKRIGVIHQRDISCVTDLLMDDSFFITTAIQSLTEL